MFFFMADYSPNSSGKKEKVEVEDKEVVEQWDGWVSRLVGWGGERMGACGWGAGENYQVSLTETSVGDNITRLS